MEILIIIIIMIMTIIITIVIIITIIIEIIRILSNRLAENLDKIRQPHLLQDYLITRQNRRSRDDELILNHKLS